MSIFIRISDIIKSCKIFNDRVYLFIGWGVVIGIIIQYFYNLSPYIINVPYGDEYGATLYWLKEQLALEGFYQKFIHLFSQANEHRLFIHSLTILLDFTLFGNISFIRMGIFGNLTLLLLTFQMAHASRIKSEEILKLLPVVILIFVPMPEISDWPIVLYNTVIPYIFGFLALNNLQKPGIYHLILALFFSSILSFSYGNGMFIFPSGIMLLLCIQERNPLKWGVWIIAALLIVLLYFTSYNFSGGTGFAVNLQENPLLKIQFILLFFGSLFGFIGETSVIYPMIIGGIALTYLGYLIIGRWHEVKKFPVIVSFLLFILLSAGAVSLFRSSLGLLSATSPRYVLLQSTFYALLYFLTINVYAWKRSHLIFLIILSFMFYKWRLDHIDYTLYFIKNKKSAPIVVYYQKPEELTKKFLFGDQIKSCLDHSRKSKMYVIPQKKEFLEYFLARPVELKDMMATDVKFHIDTSMCASTSTMLTGWVIPINAVYADAEVMLLLSSDTLTGYLHTQKMNREQVIRIYKSTIPHVKKECGFYVEIQHPMLPEGDYKIGWCFMQNDIPIAYHLSEECLTIN